MPARGGECLRSERSAHERYAKMSKKARQKRPTIAMPMPMRAFCLICAGVAADAICYILLMPDFDHARAPFTP